MLLFIRKVRRKNDFVVTSAECLGGIITVIKFTTGYYLRLPAVTAAELLRTTIKTENSVHNSAIKIGDVQMLQNENLFNYKASITVFMSWFRKGIITEKELNILDTKLCEKYGISSCSIYRPNPLIYNEKRAIYGLPDKSKLRLENNEK